MILDTPATPEKGRSRWSHAPDGTPLISWTKPDSDSHALRTRLWRNGAWAAPVTAQPLAGDRHNHAH